MSAPRQTHDPVPPLPRNPWSRRRLDEWPVAEEGPDARSFEEEWGTIPLVLNPDGSDPVRTGPPPRSPHLAASLNWTLAATDHAQERIHVGDAEIEVDAALAPLVSRLNAISCDTLTSCAGSSKVWGYVMFTEVGGREFQKFWHRQLAPLGYAQPVLDHELRDADWRAEVGADYPFPKPVPVGRDGINFTLRWRLHWTELSELMRPLLAALDRELAA